MRKHGSKLKCTLCAQPQDQGPGNNLGKGALAFSIESVYNAFERYGIQVSSKPSAITSD